MALYILIQDIIENESDETKNEKYYNEFLKKELIDKGLLYYSEHITNFKDKIEKLMSLKNENKLNTLEEKQKKLNEKLNYYNKLFLELEDRIH